MKLYLLEPEVAGGLGENTVIDNYNDVRLNRERPLISYLHYKFSGWLGDELLETTPCFIVTEALANSIKKSPLKGVLFEKMEISITDEFRELFSEIILPNFLRIIPQGKVEIKGNNFSDWSGSDFCLSQNSTLVVTESALNVLQQHKLEYCEIKELTSLS